MDILLIIIGIAIVLRGADMLTEGAVTIARRLKMPELIIGMTVVAFGTSMPEFCVSMASALNGTADMALGNVIGSNIVNVFMIIGVCAMIHPMSVSLSTIQRDLPFAFIATLMLIFMLVDGTLSKGEGLIMVAIFCIYMAYTLRMARKEGAELTDEQPKPSKRKGWMRIYDFSAFTIIVGLAELVLGSNLFVDHATSLAKSMGVSEAVIGITILGAGTSLPEFATSVVAAVKGSTSMALGNVIGSCVFNILLILGVTSIFVPLSPMGITTIDLATLFMSTLLMWMFSYTNSTMERWEGAVLTACLIAYMTILLSNA